MPLNFASSNLWRWSAITLNSFIPITTMMRFSELSLLCGALSLSCQPVYFDSTRLNLAQVCTMTPSFHLFPPRAGSAWGFFRCKLWLMSFWLEPRMRHFHYCLSKCILLGAVKSVGACDCAYVCVSASLVWVVSVKERERARDRLALLDDETHLMTFLIWFLPKPQLLGAWGSRGPYHFRKWGGWWLSSGEFFLSLMKTGIWPIISPSFTLNKTIRQNCIHSRWMGGDWVCVLDVQMCWKMIIRLDEGYCNSRLWWADKALFTSPCI